MNEKVKRQVMNIIGTYKRFGPQWKPGKDIVHLKKRIARQDVPLEYTIDEYNK